MRVGIITFHYVDNYGAVLQCAAMQEALRQLGHEPWVIDFRPRSRARKSLLRGWRHQGSFRDGFVRRILQLIHGRKIEKAFWDFRERFFNMTEACYSSEDIARVCEILGIEAAVTGSDQVWHFARSAEYFLSWKSPKYFKRISYAPSCATDDQDYSKSERISEWLSSYSTISVRDEPSARAITKATGIYPEVVADPTLLCDPSHWESESPDEPDEPYLLVYLLGDANNETLKLAVEKAKARLGLRKAVTIVASSRNPRLAPEADQVVWNGGPGVWLELIRNCNAFITDSFHGSLFAMKYRKPFLTFHVEPLRAPRLQDLADRYGIHERVCRVEELPHRIDCLQHQVSQESIRRVEQHVVDSWEFLRRSLDS